MLTSEIRKGTIVRLRNGMRAKLEDNQVRQSTRMCTVYGEEVGLFTEMGSVYSTDIIEVIQPDGKIIPVTLTDKQKATMRQRQLMGF